MDRWKQYGGAVLLLIGIALLGHAVDRSIWWHWAGAYTLAFAGYALFISARGVSTRWIIALAVVLRLVLLPTTPLFSDDHYRYLWDGLCSVQGISPFAFVPVEALDHGLKVPMDLFEFLNSPDRPTTYPPVAQLFFATAAWLGGNSILGMTIALRLLVLLAEGIGAWALFRLLKVNGLPASRAGWVLLAPLLVVELIGNLHTEVLLIPFCVLILLALQRKHGLLTGLWLGLAIATKLWPLFFVLVLPAALGWSRAMKAAMIALVVFLAGWLPFRTPELIANVGEGLHLYGSFFEFNGGLYELLKWVLPEGWVKGTPLMPAFLVVALFVLFVRQAWRSPAEGMLWAMALFLGFSSTVHPWYITPLLVLAVFTPYRWPFWYAALVVPTYLTYTVWPWDQPYGYIAAEHVLLFLVIALELMVHSTAGAMFRARIKVDRILRLIPANSTVLDIGTGNGALAHLLTEAGHTLTTLDVVDKCIFAEQRPLLFDGRALPVRSDSHDVVLLITVLHHTRHQEELLREAARVGRKVIVMEDVYTSDIQRFLTYVLDSLINLEFLDHPHTNRDETGWEWCFSELRLRVERKRVARTLVCFRQATYLLSPERT